LRNIINEVKYIIESKIENCKQNKNSPKEIKGYYNIIPNGHTAYSLKKDRLDYIYPHSHILSQSFFYVK